MARKDGKCLLADKMTAVNKDKDKKKPPVSRSSRAGLQVEFVKKHMEEDRMAYCAAAYASTPNVPTSFSYDQPVPRPGSSTLVFPEPPPSGLR